MYYIFLLAWTKLLNSQDVFLEWVQLFLQADFTAAVVGPDGPVYPQVSRKLPFLFISSVCNHTSIFGIKQTPSDPWGLS